MRIRYRFRSGFTLVEVLVVIAIIGILAGIVMGIAGAAGRRGDIGKATAELEMLKNAMEEYRLRSGSYWPNVANNAVTNNTALVAMLTNFAREVRVRDPWGRSYLYTNTGFTFNFWSRGLSETDPADDLNSARGGY